MSMFSYFSRNNSLLSRFRHFLTKTDHWRKHCTNINAHDLHLRKNDMGRHLLVVVCLAAYPERQSVVHHTKYKYFPHLEFRLEERKVGRLNLTWTDWLTFLFEIDWLLNSAAELARLLLCDCSFSQHSVGSYLPTCSCILNAVLFGKISRHGSSSFMTVWWVTSAVRLFHSLARP